MGPINLCLHVNLAYIHIWMKASVLIWSLQLKSSSWLVLLRVTPLVTRCYIIFSHRLIVMYLLFFVVVHYVSGSCNYFYCTSDGCVFQCFIYHYSGYDGPSERPTGTSAQSNVVLSPQLMQLDTRGVVGLATVLQQLPQSQMPVQAYITYAIGPLQMSFLFQSWASLQLSYICWCLMMYDFYFQVPPWMPFSLMEA